jgi:hypothetical protein
MFWTESSPSPSDPPSPTLTAVDLPSTVAGMAGSQTPTTKDDYGMSKVHPADLEVGISNMDKNEARNNTTKEERYHHERLDAAGSAALEEVRVTIVEVDDEGNLYVSSKADDPDNPRNWPKWKRYMVAGIASWLTIIASTSSATTSLPSYSLRNSTLTLTGLLNRIRVQHRICLSE